MHGVVPSLDSNAFTHRTMDDLVIFEAHLDAMDRKYESVASALVDPTAKALTIDDATSAAKSAALIARERGHEVTIFINPFNVISAKTYFFHELNIALDCTTLSQIKFGRAVMSVQRRSDKVRIRKLIKRGYCLLKSEEECSAFISEICAELGVHSPEPPEHLRTLSVRELVELQSAGVTIENHGWTHTHLSGVPESEVEKEVAQGANWLQNQLNRNSSIFAVPFGDIFPTFKPTHCGTWLAMCKNSPTGQIAKAIGSSEINIYNRSELRLYSS